MPSPARVAHPHRPVTARILRAHRRRKLDRLSKGTGCAGRLSGGQATQGGTKYQRRRRRHRGRRQRLTRCGGIQHPVSRLLKLLVGPRRVQLQKGLEVAAAKRRKIVEGRHSRRAAV